jgi:hypothetical protein
MPGKHDKYQIYIIKMNLNTAWQTQDHARAALDPVLLPLGSSLLRHTPLFPPSARTHETMTACCAADPAGEGAPGADASADRVKS